MSKGKRKKLKLKKGKLHYNNATKDKYSDIAKFVILIVLFVVFVVFFLNKLSKQKISEPDVDSSSKELGPNVDSENAQPIAAPKVEEKPIPETYDYLATFDREEFVYLKEQLKNYPFKDGALKITLQFDNEDVEIQRLVYPDVPAQQPSLPLSTGSPPIAADTLNLNTVDNATLEEPKNSMQLNNVKLTGDGQASVAESEPVIGIDGNNNSDFTPTPKPPPPDPVKKIIKFKDIFEAGSNGEKNGGVSGDETFYLELSKEPQNEQLDLQLMVKQTNESIPLDWPASMFFKIVGKPPAESGKPYQLKLRAGKDWKFQLTTFLQVDTLKVPTTDGKEESYIKQPQESSGMHLESKVLELYREQEKSEYFFCEFKTSKVNSQVWMPVLLDTVQSGKGTRFRENGKRHEKDFFYKKLKEQPLTVIHYVEGEPAWGIDPILRSAIIQSRDYSTQDLILECEDRLRYLTTQKNRVTGFVLESIKDEIEYYPLSIGHAISWQTLDDGNIFFQPSSRTVRVDIKDDITKNRVKRVSFSAGSDIVEIGSDSEIENFYELELRFRKQEEMWVGDWVQGKVEVSAEGYKSKTIEVLDLGDGKTPEDVTLSPLVKNLVILIPLSAQFKKQFELEYTADGDMRKANSIDKLTQKPIYFSRSEGNRDLGLLPRFIRVIQDTVLRGVAGMPEPAKSLEVEIYWVTNSGLKKYQEDMANVSLDHESMNYKSMLSGEFGEIFDQYRTRFGSHTTVIALIAGMTRDLSEEMYDKEIGRVESLHTVLFSHSNNFEFEDQKVFAQKNSDISHIVDNPSDLEVLTREATNIARRVLNELRK